MCAVQSRAVVGVEDPFDGSRKGTKLPGAEPLVSNTVRWRAFGV